jgi:hypothetical protein
MSLAVWAEIQEGILIVFGPLFIWWLVIIAAGGVLTAIGVVIMEVVGHMTR